MVSIAVACFSALVVASSQPPAQDPDTAAFTTGEWHTTPSGLEYRVLRAGANEPPPDEEDKVTMRWSSRLAGGAAIASTAAGAEPDGAVGSLPMAGWNEGLRLMTPGAHYLFRVPPALAYGETGFPPTVPGNATIYLDVELVSITKIPRFRVLRPEATQRAHRGLLYEVIEEGHGPPPRAGDQVRYHMTYWNASGKRIESSHYRGPFDGAVDRLTLPIMREALRLMRPHSTVLFCVPDELTFPVNSQRPSMLPEGEASYWLFELQSVTRPLPVPPFALPDPAHAQRKASGLVYEVVRAGAGESPGLGAKVRIHYAGWLKDGTLFDSSFVRGGPVTLGLGGVIAGWREALRTMQPGAVYRLSVPPELGYGSRGSPPKIPPQATLVFWIELIEVVH